MSNNANSSPTPPPSVLNWFEIPVSDVSRALPLYSAVLGRKLAPSSFEGDTMVLLGSNGCLVADGRSKPSREGTVVYLDAKDGVRATLARALDAGAKVVLPETSIAPHGTIAKIEDLDGNIVGLHAEPGK